MNPHPDNTNILDTWIAQTATNSQTSRIGTRLYKLKRVRISWTDNVQASASVKKFCLSLTPSDRVV
jgi:hypothetical protein